MAREVTEQLKQLRHGAVAPRPEWLKNNRELLLAQIKNTIPADNQKVNQYKVYFGNFWNALSVLFPRQFVFNVVRPLSVLLVILSVITSGWIGTVDAAYEAMPGDWLYPAKRAVEKTRVTVAAVTGDKNTETKLHSEFAKRRAQETKKIIAGADPAKNARAVQSVSDLKDEINAVNSSLDAIKNDSSVALSADVVKNVNNNTEQVKIALQDVKDSLIANSASSTMDGLLTKDVAEAKDLTKDTAVKAVEVVVTKHLEGTSTLSKDEVTQVVNNALETAATDIASSKQDALGIGKVITTAQTEVKDLSQTASVKNNVAAASSTKQFSDQIAAVATETKDSVNKTVAATVVADKKITEAANLLSTGDLSKVADKVKEVTEATKVIEKINDQTLQNVQAVLPNLNVAKDTMIKTTVSSTPAVVVTTTPAVGVASTTIKK
ncbi:MAG: DUF5667 domain-containing protein [bacterium]|nr:DUF5667 domain-containing protein [bacterium]